MNSAWAATELYITTRNDDYYRAIHLPQVLNTVPSWGDVGGLVWMSLAQHRRELTPIADQQLIATRIDELANILCRIVGTILLLRRVHAEGRFCMGK